MGNEHGEEEKVRGSRNEGALSYKRDITETE